MKMKIVFACLLGFVASTAIADGRIEMTSSQAATYYKYCTRRWTTCHDPSVVWDSTTENYYIFGSHLAQAATPDLQNWTTFRAPWGVVAADGTIRSGVSNAETFVTNHTKSVKKGGKYIPFGDFNAYDWVSAYGEGYRIDGNLWAPDVIYNETMNKWCMYMSLNGPYHNSVIVLLTSDKVDGTYIYQGPVVYTGFKKGGD